MRTESSRKALSAGQPLVNVSAPATPFAMSEYQAPGGAEVSAAVTLVAALVTLAAMPIEF